MPDLVRKSVFEIDLEELRRQGIRGLILDLDNTVIYWNRDVLESKMYDWFYLVHVHQFEICFLSNNFSTRVSRIAKEVNAYYVARAWKPFGKGFKSCIKKMNLPSNSVAVIGDQLFTDILGGNCAGLFTILVNPLSKDEFVTTKIMRIFEKKILQKYK